jgi:hypothetical protein
MNSRAIVVTDDRQGKVVASGGDTYSSVIIEECVEVTEKDWEYLLSYFKIPRHK